MPEPCSQEKTIEAMASQFTEITKALQAVAVQKNEIKHLLEHQGDHREWLKDHEKRIQKIEQQPSQAATRWYWMAIAAMVGILSSVGTKIFAAAFIGG